MIKWHTWKQSLIYWWRGEIFLLSVQSLGMGRTCMPAIRAAHQSARFAYTTPPLKLCLKWTTFLSNGGAYLRRNIVVKRRVGDYVHCNCRVLCNFVKRVRQWCHSKGCHRAVRDIDAFMATVKEHCAGIPEVDGIAPRRTKEGHFDLTSSSVFMQNAEWQKTLTNIVKEHFPQETLPNGHFCVGGHP